MVDTGTGLRSGATPLAVRMRPTTLDEVAGQRHLLSPGSPLVALASDRAGTSGSVSVILWGPPGTGKTTLAQAIARSSGRRFVELSAVTAGVRDVRQVMEEAQSSRDLYGLSTVLFLDEIHRFTKAQQDALLPGVENGWVILVAATTENPSFSVISPLLSRSLLLTLELLSDDDLGTLVDRAANDPRGLAGAFVLEPEAREAIVRLASGDARRALTALEASANSAIGEFAAAQAAAAAEAEGASDDLDAATEDAATEDAATEDAATEDAAIDDAATDDAATDSETADGATGAAAANAVAEADDDADRDRADAAPAKPTITAETVARAVDRALLRYDRNGDEHYDVISAFIKSVRGSDVDAALHYLARMIEAGEDPRFIARRIIVLASEDIGMADPTALGVAVAAADAVALIGMPEGRIPLAQAVVHLATAPKSNAAYLGINQAISDVRAGKAGRVPKHLRDAHYAGAKQLGHGKGYRYPHDADIGVVPQQYLPDTLSGARYYEPTEHGYERELSARLAKLRRIVRGEG